MLRYQRGDAAAFEQLYRRHRDPLYRYFLRGCSNRDRAAEMFQDLWMNVVRSHASWEPRAKFTTWIYRMAHNRLVDEYRAAKPAAEELEAEAPMPAPEHLQPERQASSAQAARRILRALAGLPAEQREAFVMQQESGMSLDEIGAATGVGRETVKSRLRYALAKLRQELADD